MSADLARLKLSKRISRMWATVKYTVTHIRSGEPLVFYHSAHKKLWSTIAKNPGMYKQDVANEYFNGEELRQLSRLLCPSCRYASRLYPLRLEFTDDVYQWLLTFCRHCPFNLKSDTAWFPGNCLNGLYDEWRRYTWEIRRGEDQFKDMAALVAQKICDLPVRVDVVCV